MNVWLLFFSMITHSGPCEMIANDRILGADLAKALLSLPAVMALAGILLAWVVFYGAGEALILFTGRLQQSAAEGDAGRRTKAAATGAVSGEELAHSRDTLADSRAALIVAQRELDQTLAKIGQTPVSQNPDVLAAVARVRDAAVHLSHMRIVAPEKDEQSPLGSCMLHRDAHELLDQLAKDNFSGERL